MRSWIPSLLVIAWLALLLPASAQQDEGEVELFLQELFAGDHGECLDGLASYEHSRPAEGDRTTLDLLHEGYRIACESLRLLGEAERLNGERLRLILAAAKLDEEWTSANRINPEAFPDVPGRDRSQQIMRSDATTIERTVGTLRGASDNLRKEAKRLLTLARAEARLLPDSMKVRFAAAIVVEERVDVLQRLIGKLLSQPPAPKQI